MFFFFFYSATIKLEFRLNLIIVFKITIALFMIKCKLDHSMDEQISLGFFQSISLIIAIQNYSCSHNFERIHEVLWKNLNKMFVKCQQNRWKSLLSHSISWFILISWFNWQQTMWNIEFVKLIFSDVVGHVNSNNINDASCTPCSKFNVNKRINRSYVRYTNILDLRCTCFHSFITLQQKVKRKKSAHIRFYS